MYSGETVLKLLDAVYAEADAAIQEAWQDGYKQGVKEYAPQTAALEEVNRQLLEQVRKERSGVWVWAPAAGAAGALLGFGAAMIFNVVR